MALRRFEHLSASSFEHAAELAAAHPGRAAFVGGGTDLLGAIRTASTRPARRSSWT